MPMPMPHAIFLTALLAAASPAARIGAEALRLASLGSSLDPRRRTDDGDGASDAASGPGSRRDGGADLSSLACSAPPGLGGGGSGADDGAGTSAAATCESEYGVDRSFPVHRASVDSTADGDGPGGRADFYTEFLHGCRARYAGRRCDDSEAERVAMNLRQPAGMRNYTALGFRKARAPAGAMAALSRFWTRRFAGAANVPNETWPPGDTYTNHWSSPTGMLPLDAPARRAVWDGTREALERWSGAELTPTSLYGARVYAEGSVLAPHVDRMPLVISAVVNVAQDVDDPWPLELYGHDGRAYNVTMEPGDMVMYEGGSVIHGRPFPLRGRYYANVFVHFEPLGHTLRHEERNAEDDEESLEYLYEKAWKKMKSKCIDDEECRERVDLNVDNRVPHYIVPGSEEERRWLQTHPMASVDTSRDSGWVRGLNAHTAASTGDLDALVAIAKDNPDAIRRRDDNGWNPLHEAVRGGHIDVAKWLIERGLDKDERTHTGNGGTPLWWAKKTHGVDHPIVKYLEGIGAVEIPPQGHKKIKKEEKDKGKGS